MGILTIIRQRPENQKRVFSFVAAIVLTFFIVGIWFSFSKNSDEELAGEQKETLSSISPIQMIKEEFSKAFSNLGEETSDSESSSTVQVEVIQEDLMVSTSSATTTATSTESEINI